MSTPETALIQIRLFAAAADAFGTDALALRAGTVAEALAALCEGADEQARQVVARSSVLHNAVACTDHSRALAEGDRLDVLPPFAGG